MKEFVAAFHLKPATCAWLLFLFNFLLNTIFVLEFILILYSGPDVAFKRLLEILLSIDFFYVFRVFVLIRDGIVIQFGGLYSQHCLANLLTSVSNFFFHIVLFIE